MKKEQERLRKEIRERQKKIILLIQFKKKDNTQMPESDTDGKLTNLSTSTATAAQIVDKIERLEINENILASKEEDRNVGEIGEQIDPDDVLQQQLELQFGTETTKVKVSWYDDDFRDKLGKIGAAQVMAVS